MAVVFFASTLAIKMNQRIAQHVVERLCGNNISAFYVENRRDAFERVMAMIPEGSVVGFGDSLTLRQIGVVDASREATTHF